ncbi:MAG: PEGA domain-containing protein [Candidatus Levybacteria bacterium]|nr:PEGA domain-containing protein [Candidatus Levybacteria bacterium]
MKRALLFLAPLLIAIVIFSGILFFLDKKTGKGALQVTSVPKSKVYLENKLVGTTPLCICDLDHMLSIGDYDVKLAPMDGNYRPFEDKVTINKGTLTVIDRTFANSGGSDGSIISLSPLGNKKDVELLVISLPDKANVFLDSSPVGVTPLLLKQVSESDHDIRITRDGYKEKSIKIKTALGFRLNSFIFLGISPDLPGIPLASSEALLSPTVVVSRVLILNTPTGFLRVREGNSVTSSEIAQVKPGESYELVSEEEDWLEIKLNDGKKGWVSASYAVKE